MIKLELSSSQVVSIMSLIEAVKLSIDNGRCHGDNFVQIVNSVILTNDSIDDLEEVMDIIKAL